MEAELSTAASSPEGTTLACSAERRAADCSAEGRTAVGEAGLIGAACMGAGLPGLGQFGQIDAALCMMMLGYPQLRTLLLAWVKKPLLLAEIS